MPHVKAFLFILLTVFLLPACAPRVAVKPIPADTPPDKVVKMAMSGMSAVKGIKASVKVSVQAEGKGAENFDGVLYIGRPDRVRLTGLAFMGFTAFDVSLTAGKFYFYQPSEGFLYTGPRAALGGFLKERGVDADPEVIYRSLFMGEPAEGQRFLVEKTINGYDVYITASNDGVLTPVVKAEFDPGLGLVRKIFYDELARPYLYVTPGATEDVDGFRLPRSVEIKDSRSGYTVTVVFEKYLVNPEGLDSDFTIQGGDLKGIRQVE
jgi:hypothetical protein